VAITANEQECEQE
jgi:hypothetical protein